MCYECLKHFSKDMEYCSSCYFALLCSENCKNQHNNYTCILQMRKNHLVKVENKFKKYNLKIQNSSSKSYLLSAYLFSSDKSSIYMHFLNLKFLKHIVVIMLKHL